jgi:hypothetical protein
VFGSVFAEISFFLFESSFNLDVSFLRYGYIPIVHKKSNESFLCENDPAANIPDHV